MTIEIIRRAIPRARLTTLAEAQFGDMVKAVADVERRVMAIGGELHSDEEAALIEDGSAQANLWGVNLYPAEPGDAWIEFDSMINVRPSQGNGRGMSTIRYCRNAFAKSSQRWCRVRAA